MKRCKNRLVLGVSAALVPIRLFVCLYVWVRVETMRGVTHSRPMKKAKLQEDSSEVHCGLLEVVYGASDHFVYSELVLL